MSPTRDWAVWRGGGKGGWRGWKNGRDSDTKFKANADRIDKLRHSVSSDSAKEAVSQLKVPPHLLRDKRTKWHQTQSDWRNLINSYLSQLIRCIRNEILKYIFILRLFFQTEKVQLVSKVSICYEHLVYFGWIKGLKQIFVTFWPSHAR